MTITGRGMGVSTLVNTPSQAGFVGVGTGGFYPAQFDDFSIVGGIIHTYSIVYIIVL